MNNKAVPRLPIDAELTQLAKLVAGGDGVDLATVSDQLEDAAVAVFDRYQSDGPGYAGKVAVVVWPAHPGMVSVATCDRHGNFTNFDTSDMALNPPPMTGETR